MSRVVVFMSVTLDGVMQAPGRPDEDVRGGFQHGGWAQAYNDPVMAAKAGEGMTQTRALLFGRRTYEDFASVWPHRPADDPFAAMLNTTQKYVASTTLTEPLPWARSILLPGDVTRAVTVLRDEPGRDIVILGSGELVRSLMRSDLIDAYTLLIHPLVLGSGQRLFPEDGPLARLRLVDSVTTGTGVVMGTYEPIGR